MHFREIQALATASRVDITIGVMCTLGSAQATGKDVQFGLFLMPTRHGPIGHKPASKVNIRTKCPPVLAYLISDRGSVILRVSGKKGKEKGSVLNTAHLQRLKKVFV